jgi:CubicO group peptidase (beta-lactamase class C family)
MYQTVLKPLAMTSSTYEQPGPDDMPPGAATGHTAQGKPIPGRWHIYPEMAAAGLWTTPSDVARYAVEIQLAHEGKSHKILSREMVEQMLSPQGGGPVGLGPFLQDKSGSRYFEHSGSDAGFQCQFVAGLDRGQGAVVMTNGQNGGVLANEVINSVAVVYGWPNFLPPEREATQPDAEKADAK